MRGYYKRNIWKVLLIKLKKWVIFTFCGCCWFTQYIILTRSASSYDFIKYVNSNEGKLNWEQLSRAKVQLVNIRRAFFFTLSAILVNIIIIIIIRNHNVLSLIMCIRSYSDVLYAKLKCINRIMQPIIITITNINMFIVPFDISMIHRSVLAYASVSIRWRRRFM